MVDMTLFQKARRALHALLPPSFVVFEDVATASYASALLRTSWTEAVDVRLYATPRGRVRVEAPELESDMTPLQLRRAVPMSDEAAVQKAREKYKAKYGWDYLSGKTVASPPTESV